MTTEQERAFFSDGTEDYRTPAQPEKNSKVRIRLRAPAGYANRIMLCVGEEAAQMHLLRCGETFDYYELEISVGEESLYYHFEILYKNEIYYYGKLGISRDYRPEMDFEILPGFSVPEWARGAVMYQIFIDRFRGSDSGNGVESGEYYYIKRHVRAIANWYRAPGDFDVTDFYGGDLAGVIEKLDYLKDLGIEAIYFNPLFVSPSSHKYDTQDYDYIDPHIGIIVEDGGELLKKGERDNSKATRFISRVTNKKNLEASNKLFVLMVQEAHKRGIRVIMDGVFNHCGSFNKWLDREGIYRDADGFEHGAFYDKDSPYHNFFRFYDEDAFPRNTTYEGWWGHDTLPKLNYEGSKELEDYIIGIGRKWVSPPYNCDGWRLDVAADLGHSEDYNHKFWKRFRREVKEANPEAVIIAEHYGDPSAWLQGDEWDTVMNYDAFMEPVSWFLTGMEKHSEDFKREMLGNDRSFFDAMLYNMARFPTASLQCAMNQLSNHDHSRFLTRTNHMVGRASTLGAEAASQGINKGVFKSAVIMQMTWPGAPTLYYGDEAGLCGFTDPDNRRTYPWRREDKELLEFHKVVIRMHKEHPALRTGSVYFLYGKRNFISYARFNQKEQLVVVINNDMYSSEAVIPVWQAGIPKTANLQQILYTREKGFSTRHVQYEVRDGMLKITLPRYSSVVLRYSC